MKVSKEEFEAAIKAYPRRLEYHVMRICEPDLLCYLDWSLPSEHPVGSHGKFNDSLVGTIRTDWLGPNGEVDREDHRRFWTYHLHEQNKTT